MADSSTARAISKSNPNPEPPEGSNSGRRWNPGQFLSDFRQSPAMSRSADRRVCTCMTHADCTSTSLEQMASELGVTSRSRLALNSIMEDRTSDTQSIQKKHVVAAIQGDLPTTDDSPKYSPLAPRPSPLIQAWVKGKPRRHRQPRVRRSCRPRARQDQLLRRARRASRRRRLDQDRHRHLRSRGHATARR